MIGESADGVARRSRPDSLGLERAHGKQEQRVRNSREIRAALAALPSDWTQFHHVYLPGTRRGVIDHVVIGPSGVFVIEAKRWGGRLAIFSGVLRQNGFPRTVALESTARSSVALAKLVPSLPREVFVPVMCFVDGTGINAKLGSVSLCRSSALATSLTSRPVILSREWLNFLKFELDMSTRAAPHPENNFSGMPLVETQVAVRPSLWRRVRLRWQRRSTTSRVWLGMALVMMAVASAAALVTLVEPSVGS